MARTERPLAELRAAGIGNRQEFRQWARHNHPDKGGSLAQFQHISRLVDQVFPAGSVPESSSSARSGDSFFRPGAQRGAASSSFWQWAQDAPNRSANPASSSNYHIHGIWEAAKGLSGRLDLSTIMTIASLLREFRITGGGVDIVPASYGRTPQLGMHSHQSRARLKRPHWLPREVWSACQYLHSHNSDPTASLRVGVSHKLLRMSLKYELEGMVGMTAEQDYFPRVLSGGVNMQLPSIHFLSVHIGVCPTVQDPQRHAAALSDFEGSWIASLRTQVYNILQP